MAIIRIAGKKHCDHCWLPTKGIDKGFEEKELEIFECDHCGEEFCQDCNEAKKTYYETLCEVCYENYIEGSMYDQLVV